MKKILTLAIALCLVSFAGMAQKERFLRECVEANKDAEGMDDIVRLIPSSFILNTWAGTLHDQCEATISNKNPKFLTYISEQRHVVNALLDLSKKCGNDKDFKEIVPDLEAMKAIYDEVEVDTETTNEDNGGFDGLFADEKTTEVSVTLKQVRKLRKAAHSLRKKLK